MRSPAPKAATIPHVPALDGLRGLAVLGVLFFHAGGTLTGGYLGVDLFFVLSGYLITSLLLAEHARTGRLALGPFWIRRARRLLPAVLAIMPLVALHARYIAKPAEVRQIRWDALATLGYVANWRAILEKKSYWDLFLEPSPLEHTWSLAIEEQFYVLWPPLVLVILVVLRRSRRELLLVTLGLTLASMVAMLVWFDPAHTSRAYLGTDTRAAGILAGAALSSVLPPTTELEGRPRRVLEIAGTISMVLLGIAWVKLDGQSRWLYRGGLWATEIFAVVLIAVAVAARRSLVSRLLSSRPLAFVGTISYGLYLWHWPLFVILTRERLHLPPFWVETVRLGVTFAVALASYHVIERPIRTRGITFASPYLVVPAAFALAIGLAVWGTTPRTRVETILFTRPAGGGRWPGVYDVESRVLPPPARVPPDTLRVLVLGDSVARFLGLALRYRQEEAAAFVAERGVGSCTIFPAERRIVNGELVEGTCCAETWVADVAEARPDVTLIVLGGGYLGDRTCVPDWRGDFKARLLSLVEGIRRDGGRLVLARVPYPMGRWRHSDVMARVDCFNETLMTAAKEAQIDTLDLMSYVCPTRDCVFESHGQPLRPDGLHFDGVGAEDTARWTLRELRRLGAPR